ncbi:MAG: Si-specific NAD(P)(+) transhydrogenase [Candidatus Eisenbacteria bacterium]|uniref:NAD(P)(+) transhydrogenase (Si-specific) n=1 Tax=Eiseniibacteriota bacterium TaxID=2212470 RepID=A0A956NDF7_UNCEI|nr:Si-specific NAD(P)(+) transhydrogenase [Candidatus Eisenbacteria bacterium]
MERYDLVVIGSGPAGQRAAVQAAKLGKRVAIVEKKRLMGGVCLHTGTIPSKTFREAVVQLTARHQAGLAFSIQPVASEITMSDVLARCHRVISLEMDVVAHQMRRNRITLIAGTASFVSPGRLVIDSDDQKMEIEADKVVIAVGTTPARPDGVDIDGKSVIDSDDVLELETLPRTLTVVGAGVIGAEYASMFAALGVEVTVIDKRDTLLPFLDREISDSLTYQMRNQNVTFRFGEEVAQVHVREDGDAEAVLASSKRVVSDVLLYSIGRVGNVAKLGLDAAEITADSRGRIQVDENYQTQTKGIYAVGDVIGFPSLAATSMYQGRHAACHAFGVEITALPHLFPYGIYSIPEISMVGKTEEELTKDGVPYEFGVARYKEIARGAILGDDTGLLKLLFHAETRDILGVHIIGTAATELVHIGQTAMALGGTIDFFVQNVFNYPTFAECYKVAALDGYNKVGPRPSDPPHPGT